MEHHDEGRFVLRSEVLAAVEEWEREQTAKGGGDAAGDRGASVRRRRELIMRKRPKGTAVTLRTGERVRLLGCPRCRSFAVWWTEIYAQPMAFQQSENRGLNPEGIAGKVGDILEVNGFCRTCGHRWAPRGVRQVTDLPGYPADDTA